MAGFRGRARAMEAHRSLPDRGAGSGAPPPGGLAGGPEQGLHLFLREHGGQVLPPLGSGDLRHDTRAPQHRVIEEARGVARQHHGPVQLVQ